MGPDSYMRHTTGCPTNENVSTAYKEGTVVIFKIMKFYIGNAILISGKNSVFLCFDYPNVLFL